MPPRPEPPLAVPRVLRLLWGEEPAGRRGPKPGLTIHEIAAAGVAIADAEGLGACSMGRVAADLNVSTMALYRYVDSKADLYLAMTDTAIGPPGLDWPADWGWRQRMASWGREIRDRYTRHPWVLAVQLAGPPLMPASLAWMDLGLEAFEGTSLDGQERLSSLLLIDMYVRGYIQLTTQAAMPGESPGGQGDPGAYVAMVGEVLRLAHQPRYARIKEVLGSGAFEDDSGMEEEFDFALDVLLDGIARRMPT